MIPPEKITKKNPKNETHKKCPKIRLWKMICKNDPQKNSQKETHENDSQKKSTNLIHINETHKNDSNKWHSKRKTK